MRGWQVLEILVEVHRAMPEEERDYAAEVHCLQQLDNAPAAAEALKRLLSGEPTHLRFFCTRRTGKE